MSGTCANFEMFSSLKFLSQRLEAHANTRVNSRLFRVAVRMRVVLQVLVMDLDEVLLKRIDLRS